MVDKTAFTGELDPVAYERIGAAFAEAQSKRSQFGQLPLQDVGIWFSSRTRDWIGREQPAAWFTSFLGAHKAMVYEHIPWGVVLDENVNLETLKRFHVVLLPNTGILSDENVTLLHDYVNDGGNLIVTGLGGCYDRWGKLQEKSAIESLTGARFVRKLDLLDSWMRFAKPFGELRTDWPFLVKGPAAVLKATTAEPFGELLQPYRTNRQKEGKEGTDWPMSAEEAVGPAVLLNQLGRGKVLTFAGSPDFATASEHHIVETRRLLRDAIRLLHPKPRVEITAPTNVESVVTDDPGRRLLRVHLIGYNGPPQTTPIKDRPYVLPALIEDAPMFRAVSTCAINR